MDLEKLSPAPWQKCDASNGKCSCKLIWSRTQDVALFRAISLSTDDFEEGVSEECAQANAEFVALARNALDIQMRRHWPLEYDADCDDVNPWYVVVKGKIFDADDPLTPYIDAEKWFVENIEKAGA